MASGAAWDIGTVLDGTNWTSVQKRLAIIAALTILIDGFDAQLIGFAIPVMMKEWSVTRGDFAPVLATGLIGTALGSGLIGLLADRFGRRLALIISVFLFSLGTAAIGLANGLVAVAAARLTAGLGIGAGLPIATTMVAEFTPNRFRTVTVAVATACVSIGGMLAGIYSSLVLASLGWRAFFIIGGGAPFVLAMILVIELPESPRWLARRKERWTDLVRLLRRMGHKVPDDVVFVDLIEQSTERHSGLTALFRDGRTLNTCALWAAFFLSMLTIYATFSWLPTALAAAGLDIAATGSGLTAYNIGGLVGTIACGAAMSRLGARLPLVLCCAGAAISAYLLSGLDPLHERWFLFIALAMNGLFVNGVIANLYAVAAYAYPTNIRATGTASALAFGRLGAILSAFAGAMILGRGGTSDLWLLLACTMAIAMGALALLRVQMGNQSRHCGQRIPT